MSGDSVEWKAFDRKWQEILKDCKAAFLHTKDAVALKRPFSPEEGWDRNRVDAFLADCVTVLEQSCAAQKDTTITGEGLRPCAVRVDLDGFKRAQDELDDLGAVTEVCATQCLEHCARWWQLRRAHWLYLFFDRGEPYRGHIEDRIRSPRATREFPLSKRIKRFEEVDMRNVPALQAVDRMAWSVSHWNKVNADWHARVLRIPRDDDPIDHSRIAEATPESLAKIKAYKLPPRKKLS
jgi:hypothetical protein